MKFKIFWIIALIIVGFLIPKKIWNKIDALPPFSRHFHNINSCFCFGRSCCLGKSFLLHSFGSNV